MGERPAALVRLQPPTIADLSRFVLAVRGPLRGSACRAIAIGAWVFVTLRRSGLRPLVQDRPDLPDGDPIRARHVATAVDAGLGLLPVRITCLRRSLTLQRELHRSGIRAALALGVRQRDGRVEAHAWIEVGGEVVNDPAELVATYRPLAVGDAGWLMAAYG